MAGSITGGITFRQTGSAPILAVGFGTAVAMWTVGYLCRLPPTTAPSWLILMLMLTCLLAGGGVAGRYTGQGWKAGPCACLLASLLNLMILGSLLAAGGPDQIVPPALWWLPGSFLVAAILGTIGGAVGGLPGHRRTAPLNWTNALVCVLATATLLLLLIGGLVTGHEAGLAVVDWPNSFGHNMFLYPLSRMTGGIYYEHAHRLFGSLVGLTTLVLAVYLTRTDERRWLKRFAWIALLTVIIQGLLGGLRVTGRFTFSTSPEDMTPSITLAMVHGTLGQVFFAMVIALAVFTATAWRHGQTTTSCGSGVSPASSPPGRRCHKSVSCGTGVSPVSSSYTRTAGTDRTLSAVLVGLLIVQLVLGTVLRHITGGLHIHISTGVVVVLTAVAVGVRAWGLYPDLPHLPGLGRKLIYLTAAQVSLGIAAFIAVGATADVQPRPAIDVIITTAHQALGALVLACAVMLMLWSHRILRTEEEVLSAEC